MAEDGAISEAELEALLARAEPGVADVIRAYDGAASAYLSATAATVPATRIVASTSSSA